MGNTPEKPTRTPDVAESTIANTLIKQSKQGGYKVTEIDIVDEQKLAELENSKLVFTPEFIPLHLAEKKKYKLSLSEATVYGFMRFYLRNNPDGFFYFTNEQIGLMLDMSEQTASRCVRKVLECGEFAVVYKIKANGGTFRLIKNDESYSSKMTSDTNQKRLANKNSINKNKIKREQSKKVWSLERLKGGEVTKALNEEGFNILTVEKEVKNMLDWLESTGKRYKNYLAFARKWVRKAVEEGREKQRLRHMARTQEEWKEIKKQKPQSYKIEFDGKLLDVEALGRRFST